MRRAAVALALGLGCLASSPAGASVSVVLGSSDPDSLYFVGEVIHLTVHVTADEGETEAKAFGQIQFPNALVTRVAQGQTALPGDPVDWATGGIPCTTVNRCVAFNQVWDQRIVSGPVAIDVTSFPIAFADYAANAAGVVDFTWGTTPSTQRLEFFGVTSAPGYTVTIVPEPATAALLAASLLGLGLAVRRRTESPLHLPAHAVVGCSALMGTWECGVEDAEVDAVCWDVSARTRPRAGCRRHGEREPDEPRSRGRTR